MTPHSPGTPPQPAESAAPASGPPVGGGPEDAGAAGPTGAAGGTHTVSGGPAGAGTAEDRSGAPGPGAAAAPVNPGAWDARSWVLLDGSEVPSGPVTGADRGRTGAQPAAVAPSAASSAAVPEGAAPRAGAADRTHGRPCAAPGEGAAGRVPEEAPERGPGPERHGVAPRVVWPEAGRADDMAAFDAAGVPAVEQTGVTGHTPVRPPESGTGAPSESDVRAPSEPGTGAADEARAGAAGHAAGQGHAPRVRASADPVRALMHQYRELCEQAVDPLEIAAGLEARGVTDRTATRFRHRDVFSLAEELYARVPRAESTDGGGTGRTGAGPGGVPGAPGARGGQRRPSAPGSGRPEPGAERLRHRLAAALRLTAARVAVPLLPGVLCSGAFAALALLPDLPAPARQGVAVLGTVATLAAMWCAVRPCLRGAALPAGSVETGAAGPPPDAPQPPLPVWPALSLCALVGYALYGDWVLTALLAGGPDLTDAEPTAACRCVPIALACAVAPAVWCARFFAVRARRRLARSRSLAEFAAGVRPLLAGVVAVFTVLLLAVQSAAGLVVDGRLPAAATQAATGALGVLLFVALLLAAHGFPEAAAGGLATACLLEVFALGSVPAARLPGLDVVGEPVGRTVAEFGPSAVPAAVCAAVTLTLLVYAARALTGASAHHGTAAP
ncbi:hypothetical protein [Streptomyces armeniacus]|uniref:hypothetical protein n=1 Tax=Streptomyces armeniacus TaxID=83291 RepID=UPI001FE8BA48|nr:hypothetical protein [Streptomyces armeniacus]